ncbi:MAG: hypothetical protein ACI4CY_00300 [Candidatus Gastranaerophilaceae bacterium]
MQKCFTGGKNNNAAGMDGLRNNTDGMRKLRLYAGGMRACPTIKR